MSRRRNNPPYFAKSILIGVIILAVAAVIVAWMDQAGFDEQVIRAINAVRR